jgi:hypothetical protein
VTFAEFGKIVKTCLRDKRLFVSACELVSDDFVSAVFPTTGCMSIIEPDTEIVFGDAPIMWVSFYNLAFSMEPKRMTRESVQLAIQKAVNAFEQPLNYFTRSRSSKKVTNALE